MRKQPTGRFDARLSRGGKVVTIGTDYATAVEAAVAYARAAGEAPEPAPGAAPGEGAARGATVRAAGLPEGWTAQRSGSPRRGRRSLAPQPALERDTH